jgi:hypothetical protein
MEPGDIVRAFGRHDVLSRTEPSVADAVESASADGGSGTVACGSLFVAAEAREHVLGVAYDPLLEPQGVSV